MTDRIRTVTVILDEDYREDDVESILQAIRMVKGVVQVTMGPAVDANDYIVREKIRREVINHLITEVEK